MSTDPAASIRFFTELLGWTVEPVDMGDFTYNMLKAGDRGIAGVMPLEKGGELSSHWMPYLEVKDTDDFVARVEAQGGKGCVPPFDIPNVGRMAVVEDPQGGYFSPIASATEATTTLTNPQLGEWCWVELYTTDAKAAALFYSEVVGWRFESQDMGSMGEYYTAGLGDARVAGVVTPSELSGRPHWMSYILVEDIEALAAKVFDLGGSIKVPPHDIPGVGRAVQIHDPTGAHVALFSMPAS